MKMSASTEPKWFKTLSKSFWVNTVAISSDAGRVVGGTFFHDYGKDTSRHGPNTQGTFGTYCYDSNGGPLWRDEYAGWDGVFAVAISGQGQIVAAGGWYDESQALLRAYDAANGKTLLDFKQVHQRISSVALSDDGTVLAAAADDVYLFTRSGGSFPATPVTLGFAESSGGFVTSVAIHPSGQWLTACDMNGNIYLATIRQGQIEHKFKWTAPPVPLNPADPSKTAAVPFLCVQIAKESESFVAGGGDLVYWFTLDAMSHGKDPIRYDTHDAHAPSGATSHGTPQQNVRWVAISGDGSLVSVVANRLAADKKAGTGTIIALSLQKGQLSAVWQRPLDRNPNSTSMDAAATHISAADGSPVGTPASLYLFDARGNELWHHPTSNMNWQMFVSTNGSGIAAGGDDGNLYYFETKR